MANSKISALTSATTPLAGTEVLPVVQSSATTQVSVANLTAGRSVSGSNFVVTGSTIPANGVYLPAANSVGVATNSTLKTTVDASGNFGVGVVPSTWAGLTGLKAVEIAYVGNSLFNNNFSNFWLANNTYYNSGYKYANTGFASFYIQSAGTHQWNIAPSGTAGTAITFTKAFTIDTGGNVLVTAAGGLGYGTGSGGSVTQVTSRTTGVTLNKTNGAITLVSAAGLATFQSFTVTNSTVAATDVVSVVQKSGTDLYQIFVTAVAAGSFRITYATTGGVTIEQPVFNFAVIKGVTA
jgi:hypothetical protein